MKSERGLERIEGGRKKGRGKGRGRIGSGIGSAQRPQATHYFDYFIVTYMHYIEFTVV